MGNEVLQQRVEQYFAAVDRQDLQRVLSFFTEDASFTIATYETTFRGRDTEIAGMFTRLFSRYDTIYHGHFDHLISFPDRLACRFEVRNERLGAPLIKKNNCNFFKFKGHDFDEVFVYMSGDNALA
jgi:hypothetical protein